MYFISQIFSKAADSLREEKRLLLLKDGPLVTLHTFAFIHITSAVKPVHIFVEEHRRYIDANMNKVKNSISKTLLDNVNKFLSILISLNIYWVN